MGDETAEQRSLRQGLIREWLEDIPFSLEEYYGPLVLTMLLYGIYDAEFRDSVRVEQREDQDLRAWRQEQRDQKEQQLIERRAEKWVSSGMRTAEATVRNKDPVELLKHLLVTVKGERPVYGDFVTQSGLANVQKQVLNSLQPGVMALYKENKLLNLQA